MAARRRFARISGLEATQRAMRALPAGVNDVLAGYIREAATTTEREARRRALNRARTGDLARSIGSEVREDGLQATVGSNLYYSTFVELGTRRSRARPFLHPAFRLGLRQFRKNVKGMEMGLKARFRSSRFKPRAAA